MERIEEAPFGAGFEEGALREAIRERVAAAGTSFYWAMRLLPRERREGMYAIYAFCREVDDIADEERPVAEKLARLSAWREEIDALYAGRPSRLVARALSAPVLRYGLAQKDFLAVIDGMEMDARGEGVAPDLAWLDLYCRRVASAVGHLSVPVFGDSSAAAHRVAEALGRALQLTNILRDLEEDALRQRLYLPREILERHGIAARDPATVLRHPALAAACTELARMAESHFSAAESAMAACNRKAMRPAALMAATYRATLELLLASKWRDLGRRVALSTPQKLWLVLRHGLV